MSGAYYSENDPFAAAWLRNLISEGLIAPGDVDERDIALVQPADLAGYGQCHFFAGLGGWSYALRLAGVPDGRPLWTGSCPCQKLSQAARGRNVAQDLWPAWFRLIAAARPSQVFGEQVAHESGWVDRLCDDMESVGYQVGAAVLPAISVGADHLRPRLFFGCYTDSDRKPGGAVDAEAPRLPWGNRVSGDVVCANGLPGRVAILRAFGNSIVPQVGAEFVAAWREVVGQ